MKGYMVRWRLPRAEGGAGAIRCATPKDAFEEAHMRATLGRVDVTIFSVAEDGTEKPLPSYEEAVAENERLRAEIARLKAHVVAHDLTPSEITAAKVLAALSSWRMEPARDLLGDALNHMLDHIQVGLRREAFLKGNGDLAERGVALLDRARKAGILGVSTAERAAWARYVAAERAHHDHTLFLCEANRDDDMKGPRAAVVEAEEVLRALDIDLDTLLASATEGT